MYRIDAHAHFRGDSDKSLALLEEFDLKILNISVAKQAEGDWKDWRQEAAGYSELSKQYPNRYDWIASFDPYSLEDDDYAERTIEEIDRDFNEGEAIGLKVWKNVGMEIQDSTGKYVLVDDERYKPVFDHIEKIGKPLLMHIAEPLACWRPLEERSPHYNYYRQFPHWHMSNHPEKPSHAELMDARDRVIEQHPGLTVIGAHLGSQEYDLQVIADRLDRYPNYYIDTSARFLDLTLFDPKDARDFIIKYQDRILWSTDIVCGGSDSEMTEEALDNRLNAFRFRYSTEWDFYETDKDITFGRFQFKGLGLPDDVLEKIYVTNAQRVYPGL